MRRSSIVVGLWQPGDEGPMGIGLPLFSFGIAPQCQRCQRSERAERGSGQKCRPATLQLEWTVAQHLLEHDRDEEGRCRHIADALGYATPSNFIAMFERSFGDSPARYFAQRGELR
jgi:AraC-like DNA-binding protein